MAQHDQSYEVQFTSTALKHMRTYPRKDQRQILARIDQLASFPQTMLNVKKLIEYGVTYRLRVGRYRILFDRDDMIRVIDVVDVLPRSRAYRRK